ncbi:MAG: methyltransferase domain-containing protein [Verrucomicrobiota bacterium]
MPTTPSPEPAVRDRYAAGAQAVEPALCCPVDYDRSFLEIIPQEVIDKDYGCGDPSKHVLEGETVLDLGSGTGKICFIASQVVGAGGKVIGVDMTDDMLEVARRNAPLVAEKTGFANVEFRKGRIQDLTLDLEKLDSALDGRSLGHAEGFFQAQDIANELREKQPLIPDESIDAVVSNCVLNLVGNEEKAGLFRELYRVVKPSGRAVISDIVANENVPEKMQQDPELWSGCISGAFREDLFIKAFEEAGFQSVQVLSREESPWRVVEGIEFRSVTVAAFKGEATEGPYCAPGAGCC